MKTFLKIVPKQNKLLFPTEQLKKRGKIKYFVFKYLFLCFISYPNRHRPTHMQLVLHQVNLPPFQWWIDFLEPVHLARTHRVSGLLGKMFSVLTISMQQA